MPLALESYEGLPLYVMSGPWLYQPDLRLHVRWNRTYRAEIFTSGNRDRLIVVKYEHASRIWGPERRGYLLINKVYPEGAHGAQPFDDAEKYFHQHIPDDLPEPGDRCKYCGEELTWIGPGSHDWELVD